MRHRTKWSTYCLAAILAASSLMACAKSPTVSETGVSGYEELDGRVKAQVGEKITEDAELFTQPDRESYEVLHAGFDDSGDLDTIIQTLFPGRDDLTVSPFDSSNTEYSVSTPNYSENLTYGGSSHLIDFSENTKGYSTFLLDLDYDQYDQRHQHIETLADEHIDIFEQIEDIEIPGYSKEQAIADVYEALQKMGLAVQERPYAVYGISAETIQAYYTEQEESFKNRPNFSMPELNADDSIYCMLWNVEINHTPIVSGNYTKSESERCNVRGEAERGSVVYVATTKNHIVRVATENQFKIEEKEPEKKILSLEEILAAAPEYYKNRLLNEERTISRISFCYIPVVTEVSEQTGEYHFDLIPGWTLDASYEMPGREGVYWDVIYINAITGEIIE